MSAEMILQRGAKGIVMLKRKMEATDITHMAPRHPLLPELFFGGGAAAYCIYSFQSVPYCPSKFPYALAAQPSR